MPRKEFVGRQEELALLDTLWQAPQASLVILYGRRRVGKTRLLTHWLKGHPGQGLYWVAEPTSALDQLRSFSQALYNFTTPDTPAPLDFTYANWEQAFRQVALLASQRKMALFIDELGYLIEVNPSLPGILQKAWDHWMSQSQLILALSGSQMGVMQQMLTYDAPLYGRATAQIKLPPLSYSATQAFFPHYSAEARVILYTIWGGVPAYWERLDPNVTVLDNVRDQLLPSNTLMQEEPRLLLQDFINDAHNYVGIMRAISGGALTLNRIATRTGLAKGHISKYLSVLRDTGFVEREVPITEDPAKSRRGRYHMTDPYMRFHYRFLSAYQAKLALGEQQQMLEYIAQHLPTFIEANTWKELCREWLLRASGHDALPLTVDDAGGAWARTDTVSVVGIDREQRHLVLGTGLWQAEPAELSELIDLISKTDSIVPAETREKWRVFYVGFASSGWTAETVAQADAIVAAAARSAGNWVVEGYRLVDLAQVDADLIAWSAVM